MKAHTPGPWVISEARSTKVDLIDTQKGHAVGEVVFVDVRNPADARLIAAAPDLLVALDAMTYYFQQYENDDSAKRLFAVARAAIAKATA